MSMHLLYNALKNSILRSVALLLCAALIAPACGGGGGGSGAAGPQTEDGPSPIPEEDDNPDSIFPGPGQPALKVVGVGKGSVTGFINTPGDVDYFRMNLVGGVTYGLQGPSFFESTFSNSPGSLLFDFFDSTGATPITTTQDSGWPAGINDDTGNLRFLWLTPYTGTYYLTVRDSFISTTRDYSFRLTSSQIAAGTAREGVVSNLRSFQFLFDASGDGFVRFRGPTPQNRIEGQPLSFLTGTMTPLGVALNIDIGGNVVASVSSPSAVVPDDIFFLDDDGVPNTAPETGAFHLHYGIPSEDMADGQDDTFWNFDPTSPIFPFTGPNFNANLNQKSGNQVDPHPIAADWTIFTVDLITEDVVHLLAGQNWYMDAHFHTQYDLIDPLGGPGGSLPIVSSRPQGGFSFFDSRLVLNGFETVPPTGSTNTLEVYYSDESQVFYIQYGVNSPLVGSAIHIHAGAPGQVNSNVLIDLGTVPFPTTRPAYEPEQVPLGPNNSSRFIPGVENIIKKISNAEANALNEATFSAGWYLDVHTTPFFIEFPEIRSDAILNANLEVVSSRITSTFTVSGQDDGANPGVVRSLAGPTGQVSFVGDELAYGPVIVYLDGAPIGQLDIALASDDLACGVDSPGQSIVVTAQPGTYKYHGSAENGIYWEGEITIEEDGGGCVTIVLTEEDAVVPE